MRQSLLQLDPTVPVETPLGRGQAHVVIDYGQESDLIWVVFIDVTGECWSFRNQEVRLQANITLRGSHARKNTRSK